ncbi:hypothetical protein [Dictyobacter formicarum]|uniref:HEAT repeat domain-containing protein n=1 Tax=Dictyobacter formicarum TaxID=2778368 RepID=A0ABQ3VF04_9CHLR|nr:hypothetical protein [Dictyobacter formicarum]GHO84719.1 hypothetical protein KSZ_27250 [Dictyobacter formicarum]
MNKAQLLQEVEVLTFAQRSRRMVDFGRLALADPQLDQALAEMATGPFYERFLALQACYGSRNGDLVFASLSDPSACIRQLAVKLVALTCNQEQQRQALQIVPRELRASLIRFLRRYDLQEPIDLFLHQLAGQADKSLVSLLSFGSPELVAQYLPQLSQRFNRAQWRRLARWQPDLALTALQQRLENLAEQEELFVDHLNAVIPILARVLPDALLALLRSPLLADLLFQLQLVELWRQRPNELFDLLLSVHASIDLYKYKVHRRLTLERLHILAQQYSTDDQLVAWLEILPPRQRVEVFEAQLQHVTTQGLVPFEILTLLSRQQREQEARRIWSRTDLALRQLEVRREYAQLLPWAEACEKLDYELRHSDVKRRAQALETLARSVVYQRERLDDLLALFLEHRNEPDPARLSMFEGLNSLPPSTWQTAHLPALAELLHASLDAIDLSNHTLWQLMYLLIRLVPWHTQWAAEQMVTILQVRDTFPLPAYFYDVPPLEEQLRPELIRSIAPIFLPTLTDWRQRDKSEALVACAEAFGRQFRNFPELAQLLVQSLQKAQTTADAQSILSLLVKWQPELSNNLIPALVQQDPSWILVSEVEQYLQRYRQDLLAPFLERTTIQGRFSLEEISFLLFVDFPLTLTQSQQERYAGHLEQDIASGRDRKLLKKTCLQLAALPPIAPERLLRLSQDTHSYNQQLNAINALAMVDNTLAAEAIFSLLRGQAEKNESTAMLRSTLRALWRALRRMPEEAAFYLLTSYTFPQLMVQKEIIFLIGKLSLDAAYQYLLDLQTQSERHPDLRAAGIRALWNHLDRPQTWEILQLAASSASSSMAFKIGHISPEQLTPQELQQLLRLLHTVLQHSGQEARLELLQNIAQLSLRDTQRILTPTLLNAMLSQSTAEVEAAITAFMAICTDRDIPQLQESLRILYMDRRRMFELLPCFSLWRSTKYRNFLNISERKLKSKRKLALALFAVLAEYPATGKVRLCNAFKLLPMADIIELLKHLAETNQLHADALMDACDLLNATYPRTMTTDDLQAVQDALAEHPDERLRRVALAALIAQARETRYSSNWTPELIARLHTYQSDPSLLVAEAALNVFP